MISGLFNTDNSHSWIPPDEAVLTVIRVGGFTPTGVYMNRILNPLSCRYSSYLASFNANVACYFIISDMLNMYIGVLLYILLLFAFALSIFLLAVDELQL